MGYTRISSQRDGVSAELLVFVPRGADCEVQRLVLKNQSRGHKSLHLFSLTEFCLWNALDDMTNFQRNLSTGEVEVDGERHLSQDRVPREAQSFRLLLP